MRNSKTLIAVAVAALFPLAGAAIAGDKDKSKMGHGSFDTLDTNRDGRISRAEAASDSKIVFSSADVNGDGYLDTSEYKKSRSGSDMPTSQPQSSTTPDASGQTDTVPQESTAPPADTETPRQ